MESKPSNGSKKRPEPLWLIYGAAAVGGILLLAEAIGYSPLQRIPARLGIALVYSAFALFVGGNRKSGYVAAGLIWAVTVVTFFV